MRLMEKVPSYDRDAFQLVCLGTFDDQTAFVGVTGVDVIDYTMPKFDHVEGRKFNFDDAEESN